MILISVADFIKRRNFFDLEEPENMREKRLKRFESNSKPTPVIVDTTSHNTYDPNIPIIGRSTQLEKQYLRLTAAADPNTVRPLHILKQTLELLKKKWKDEQNYSYICDQFKSMRQDLTVQHIQNDFTVMVYEIHARIAIEKGDLGEYNQCQSQLKTLYEKGLKGHENEFLAYRILYILHTRNRSDMNELYFQIEDMRDPETNQITDPAIQHALDVNTALSTNNYHKFFQLYVNAPNMGGYIMDIFCDRERLVALSTICKAFRPQVDAKFVVQELGFFDWSELQEFSKKYGIFSFFEIKEQASPSPSNGDGSSKRVQDKKKTNSVFLKTKEAYPIIEGHRLAAFKKIDIKGQI